MVNATTMTAIAAMLSQAFRNKLTKPDLKIRFAV
jgi:hypothetical protein